uniref:NADH-ubiquinone oxidoreductase chain 5 n=1 Tax=Acanthochitona avicula TaxID=1503212 RepID=A0A6H1PGZ7_9MOLL|nr:NADH dehydrogenase subunit 5 [Acanthochitona avicula]QIZ12685.1 NADH dehydrogenase subunit 5 [Acanthochitona avicula]
MKFFKSSAIFASSFLMMYSIIAFSLQLFLMNSTKTMLIELTLFEMNSSIMSIPIILDPNSLMFSSIVCFISSSVMLFTSSYMSEDIFISRFVWIVMLFVASMNFLIFIPNLIALLLGWDGLGLVSFCLVIYYQNQKSLGAGLMTAFMNRIGDVAILLAIGWVMTQAQWDAMFMTTFPNYKWVIMMILLAGMTKSAQIPFCSWLPAAMAAPTPVSALVHSSTLVTAGVFLLIRFYPFLSKLSLFSTTLSIISASTMLMAGIAANFETDLKKIIALSTLSQLGVMMFSIAIGFPSLALLHLMAHALFKALLFLCAGKIIHSHANNQDIRKMSHIWTQLPISSTCFNIANLALCGFPFMAGFYSKDLIIETMLLNQNNYIMILMMMLATMLTASYSIRLSFTIFWSEMKQNTNLSLSDSDMEISAPIMLLASGAMFGGAALTWIFMPPLITPILNNQDKMMTLLLVFTGAWIAFIMFKTNSLKKTNMKNLFFTNMWFMSNLSNNMASKGMLNLSTSMFKFLDLGWIETMGGEGMFNQIINMTKMNEKTQMNKFNLLISMMLLPLIIFTMILVL